MKSFSPLLLFLAPFDDVQATRFIGRVNPATRELSWPGTGVSFTFTGTSAKIEIEAVTGTNSVQLQVDKQTSVILEVNGSSISTPPGLSRGKHTVTLRKRSEALFGSIFLGNVTTNDVIGPDVRPKRKIEFIGDSITAGYGLDGVLPCVNNAAVENNPKTYAALTADALGADYDIIAWSGIGLIRNYASATPDSSPIMPDRWTRYGANDAQGSYTFPHDKIPDVVVIGLGTNDFGYAADIRPPIVPADFTAGAVAFVKKIKSHYPHATFFLLTSPMMNDGWPTVEDAQHATQKKALEAAVTQLNNTRAYVVDFPPQGSEVGCDYHPNAATHAQDAGILTAAVAKAMRW